MLLRTLTVPAALVFLAACVEGEPSALVGPEDGTAPMRTAKGKGGGRPQPPADPVIVFLNFSRQSDDELIVMNADGSNQTVIYSAPHMLRPSWSPDGGSIVFRRDSETSTELWIVDVDTDNGKPQGTAHMLTPCEGSVNLLFIGCEPAWSPSPLANEIAFAEHRPGELRVIAAVGEPIQKLLYSAQNQQQLDSPTWSPDGTRIAVVERLTTIMILTLDQDAQGNTIGVLNTKRLPFAADFQVIGDLDWSRTEANLLAFSAVAISGGAGVYTLDIFQSEPTPVKVIEGQSPTWSPNDKKLAFIRRPQQILMSVDLSTLKTKRLAKDALDPDWARQTQQQ